MTVYVFTGPTLSHGEGAALLEATFMPPAAQGDVFRAVMQQPVAIGIIDGYFHKVPSVWHKEILLAMAEGVHVFGSASMGALRAAELHSFGMIGVGRIFEGYAAGDIKDDDEVAVIHGPPETGYVALSDAMVNIRATLRGAESQGVIAPTTHQRLIDLAKATFFQHRSYASLLRTARTKGLPQSELDSLCDWLHHGKINQKKDDAIEMLRSIDALMKISPPKKEIEYFVENTYTLDDES